MSVQAASGPSAPPLDPGASDVPDVPDSNGSGGPDGPDGPNGGPQAGPGPDVGLGTDSYAANSGGASGAPASTDSAAGSGAGSVLSTEAGRDGSSISFRGNGDQVVQLPGNAKSSLTIGFDHSYTIRPNADSPYHDVVRIGADGRVGDLDTQTGKRTVLPPSTRMDLQAQGAAGLLHDLDGKVSPKALAAVNAAVGWADPVRGLPFVASNYDVGKLEADEKAQVAALTGRYGDPTVLSGTDQSVPGHPSRGSDYTQYGQLYVKEPIAGDFRTSVYSNADDWFQKKTLLQLERANPHGATIVDPLDSVHPTPRLQPARAGAPAVYWNGNFSSTFAGKNADGGTATGGLSPAQILAHELAHANLPAWASRYLTGRPASGADAGFGNLEERRVIAGADAHLAATLGRPFRTDHGGSDMHYVRSPLDVPTTASPPYFDEHGKPNVGGSASRFPANHDDLR